MKLRPAAAITILLMASGAWAQSPAPAPAPAAPANTPTLGLPGNPGANGFPMARPRQTRKPAAPPEVAPSQRLSEMESTLTSMHALLKQMQDKAAANPSKDSNAKANLPMWEFPLRPSSEEFF